MLEMIPVEFWPQIYYELQVWKGEIEKCGGTIIENPFETPSEKEERLHTEFEAAKELYILAHLEAIKIKLKP